MPTGNASGPWYSTGIAKVVAAILAAGALVFGAYTVGGTSVSSSGRIYGTTIAASTMSKVACATNVVTVTTTAAHGMAVGQPTVVNAADNTYDATVHVATVPSATTFTFALTHGNEAEKADAGTVTPVSQVQLGAAATVPDPLADCLFAASSTTRKPVVIQALNGQAANLQEWQAHGGSPQLRVLVNASLGFLEAPGLVRLGYGAGAGGADGSAGLVGIDFVDMGVIRWADSSTPGRFPSTWSTVADTALARSAAGVLKVTNASTGTGDLLTGPGVTAATATLTYNGVVRDNWVKCSVTTAMAQAGAETTLTDVALCTLPALACVKRCFVKITGQGVHADTLTVSVGRTGASYIDYVVASDAKGVANTIYGNAMAEIGTNLKDAAHSDSPIEDFAGLVAVGATTTVYAQVKCGSAHIHDLSGLTFDVYLEYYVLP